ncbi:MAG: TrkA family potassium uptake protein [bacterium]|nr:TrkA family potassium uptake protein [Candidatus Margulisiibacteriota bacterium]
MNKQQYAVLGLGRFGSKVARELYFKKQEVIVIDQDENIIQNIKDQVTHAFVGDITDENALKEAGVCDCDVVVVAESSSIESNIIAAQVCKGMGIKKIICKARNTVHGKILQTLGVNEVIYPEQDTAIKLVNRLTSSGVLDYFELDADIHIVGATAPKRWENKSLTELALRKKNNVTVLAIQHGDERLVVPSGDSVIQPDDVVILLGAEQDLKKLNLDTTHKT